MGTVLAILSMIVAGVVIFFIFMGVYLIISTAIDRLM